MVNNLVHNFVLVPIIPASGIAGLKHVFKILVGTAKLPAKEIVAIVLFTCSI